MASRTRSPTEQLSKLAIEDVPLKNDKSMKELMLPMGKTSFDPSPMMTIRRASLNRFIASSKNPLLSKMTSLDNDSTSYSGISGDTTVTTGKTVCFFNGHQEPHCFDDNVEDYGYESTPLHDDKLRESSLGRRKRRRYSRRNSKTPAMLVAMLSPILKDLHKSSELAIQHEKRNLAAFSDNEDCSTTTSTGADNIDMSLDVAEDLVFRLQKRRRLSSMS